MSKLLQRSLIGILLLVGLLYLATVMAAKTTLTEHVLQTDIVIDAHASSIWQVLTNFDAYSEWNPFFQQASGVAQVSSQLYLETQSMSFSPTVLVARPEQELRWLGSVVIPGVFDGEHSFTLEPLAENRVRVIQREVFRGILVPFSGSLLRDTEQELQALNEALKVRSEKLASN